MLTKNMNDDELRDMFLPFGAVEDCVILRNPDKSSKGEYTSCVMYKLKPLPNFRTSNNVDHVSPICIFSSTVLGGQAGP